jgi:hypothetical protein
VKRSKKLVPDTERHGSLDHVPFAGGQDIPDNSRTQTNQTQLNILLKYRQTLLTTLAIIDDIITIETHWPWPSKPQKKPSKIISKRKRGSKDERHPKRA